MCFCVIVCAIFGLIVPDSYSISYFFPGRILLTELFSWRSTRRVQTNGR